MSIEEEEEEEEDGQIVSLGDSRIERVRMVAERVTRFSLLSFYFLLFVFAFSYF